MFIHTYVRLRRKYKGSSTFALLEDGAHLEGSTESVGPIMCETSAIDSSIHTSTLNTISAANKRAKLDPATIQEDSTPFSLLDGTPSLPFTTRQLFLDDITA